MTDCDRSTIEKIAKNFEQLENLLWETINLIQKNLLDDYNTIYPKGIEKFYTQMVNYADYYSNKANRMLRDEYERIRRDDQ